MRVLDAARNNAEWCDLFCRSRGVLGRFDADAWVSPARTPPLYPDAVTLVPACDAEGLLARVDAGPGCSVKDSFADLELAPFGFHELFAADWLLLDLPLDAPLGWEAVDHEFEDRRVAVLRGPDGGAIATRSAGLIGITNLVGGDWPAAAGAAQAALGQLPAVAYAGGAEAAAAVAAGFTPIGRLLVWMR